jgi:hydrogenase maturation factor
VETGNTHLYHVVPKHHLAAHLPEQMRSIGDPSCHWCYADESFIQEATALAASTTHIDQLPVSIVEKYGLGLKL